MKEHQFFIPSQSVFEDLIWMSYRYCIGRKTIACAMHADELVPLVKQLTSSRKSFMAQDIRREINHIAHIKANVTLEGYRDNYDAYSLVWEYLLNHPEIKDDTEYHWYIDITIGKVECEKEDKKPERYYESFLDEYHDMNKWCKLASFLDKDKYVVVHTNFDGNEEQHTCFESMYVFRDKIEKQYISVDRYQATPHRCQYLAPEYITSVESTISENRFKEICNSVFLSKK
jgi:hypothetical protein